MRNIEIEVIYDFICPWCWISHCNLAAALEQVGSDVASSICYVPFELNPAMRAEGMDRRAYRSRKFGSWTRSQAMDVQVTAAGLTAGARFDYDKVLRTPNTRLAHRLMQFAQQHCEPGKTAALYQALYAAYFADGRDIGSADELESIAGDQAFNVNEARAWLQSSAGHREIDAARERADRFGVQSIPTILIDGDVINGAQPPAVLVNALRSAVQRKAA
jgi:predicted DsbA family dithiol-disulfide isomerase